jgi:amino acid transporter
MIVGVVIGVGIFKTPSLVAASVGSEAMFIGVWVLGGIITLLGALCYAELGSAHPNVGGEYHFLSRAYGQSVGLLFAWARGTVIQTGGIAAIGFVYGDYATQLLPLGPYSTAIHAAVALLVLTAINVTGTPESKRLQVFLSALTVIALLSVMLAGFLHGAAPKVASSTTPPLGAIGLAMVFVLLTYGGWNEAAYLTGELRDVRRTIARTLILGTATVTVAYILTNLAYLNAFGLEGLSKSSAVGADLMKLAVGDAGAMALSLIVCVCALSTLNATIFTGARVYYALGRDLSTIRVLGAWDMRGHEPKNALLLQCTIALLLIAFGATTPEGFEAMVAYTAPVFWFFLMLVAISVFVFRRRDPGALNYRMPLYPLPPILLALAAAWMVYSSLAYAGLGSILGILVLLAGTPLLLIEWRAKTAGAGK